MGDTPNTSFIPKQSMGTVPKRAPRRKRSFSILSFVALVVFLGALLLSVGVFFYEDLTRDELAAKKQELADLKNTFSQSDIQNIQELDRRIEAAGALLAEHLSPSVVFDVLETTTQEELQYSTFSYKRNESGSAVVELSGEAARFNTVALQSQRFAGTDQLASAAFFGLDVLDGTEEGGSGETSITFTVVGTSPMDTVLYSAAPVPVDTADLEFSDDTGSVDASDTVPADTVDALDDDLSEIDDALSEIDSLLDGEI